MFNWVTKLKNICQQITHFSTFH